MRALDDIVPDARLDITSEVCPMTFVRTKLALETLREGQVLEISLRGDEPLNNIPTSVLADGHALIGLVGGEDGRYRLYIRRGKERGWG